MAIKIFIVDDHYMVIEGIRSLLQNETSIEWMGHATNSASCLAFLQHQNTTVDTHRKNILSKLGAKNTGSLIRIAAHLKLI